MDFAIQKATELGVSNIIPLFSERSNFKIFSFNLKNKMKHWKRIIIESCRQSNRVNIPNIFFPTSIYKWIKYLSYIKKIVHITNILFSIDVSNNIRYIKCAKYINIIIGSEGGISGKELIFLKNNEFKKICLGYRILRTETAVLSGITALQIYFGDM
jgi:16S rRNA (uracil1498-N3)-methyltransferase